MTSLLRECQRAGIRPSPVARDPDDDFRYLSCSVKIHVHINWNFEQMRPLSANPKLPSNGGCWPTSADSPPGRQAIECNVVRNFPKDGLRHQYATVPVGTSVDRLETHSHLPSKCHLRSFVDEMFATLPFFI